MKKNMFLTIPNILLIYEFCSGAGEPVIETASVAEVVGGGEEKEPVPLVDYVLNVMKFVDAILSNNSTDDHCKEFVNQEGLGRKSCVIPGNLNQGCGSGLI
jgi:hypothetical protein